jgi:hypothetical protein
MRGKILLGIALLIVGFIAAVIWFAGTSEPTTVSSESTIVGDANKPEREQAASIVLPVIAGVTIAAGAVLIGIGMANFKRPTVVPPNSPEEEKAATSRPISNENVTKHIAEEENPMRRRKAGA